MGAQAKVVFTVFASVFFVILFPFIWRDQHTVIVNHSHPEEAAPPLVPFSSQLLTPPQTKYPFPWTNEVNLPSGTSDPFLQYNESGTPYQEWFNKDLNAIPIGFNPYYDPFAQDEFPQPPQNIDNSGYGYGGLEAEGGGFSGLGLPVGQIVGNIGSGVGGNDGGNGNSNGGSPTGGKPGSPPVQVPEPETYIILATFLTAILMATKLEWFGAHSSAAPQTLSSKSIASKRVSKET